MSGPVSRVAPALACRGCAWRVALDGPLVWACPRRGSDDADHVLVPVLDQAGVTFPLEGSDNPFVRYRRLLSSYARFRASGGTDAGFVGLVGDLDEAVAAVDGAGFRITPLVRAAGLGDGVWVKDETGNVAGSHKGRHLMGIMLHLAVAERLGRSDLSVGAPLAVASCGNAALAAAVVAAAAGRRLRVFVPTDADPKVLDRLASLGADVTACPRTPGELGDPCYLRFREAVSAGAVPFGCQGGDNGLAIEGGATLGWELAGQLAAEAVPGDRVVIQVGGGALASATMQGLGDAVSLGTMSRLPALHVVQSEGAAPLVRAYQRLAGLVADGVVAADALAHACGHRSAYMWPWERRPQGVAQGILDDETYDWMAVVASVLETGGSALTVGESRLVEANRWGRSATAIDVDITGSAGLAGLLELQQGRTVTPGEQVIVIFTGRRR